MSLHTLANHIQSAGRGDDTVLVHMTPSEVNGLQALAMAHGGSLTINPETGLPEAGFLRAIMPTVLGFALAPMTGGFSLMGSQALGTAALVGGGYALATGSLQKGLMAGLGAYGGASLAGGLAAAAPAGVGAGMNAPVNIVTGAPAGSVGAGNFYNQLNATVGQGATTGAATASTAAAPTTTTLASPASSFAGKNLAAANAAVPVAQAAPAVAPPIVGSTPGAAPSVLGDIKQSYQQLGEGARRVFSDPEKLKAFVAENKYPLIGTGLSALARSQPEPQQAQEVPLGQVYEYNYDREFRPSRLAPGSSSERMYFAADGGLASLGPVEQMSQQNALMDNTRYPMAFQQTPTYASPAERPIAQNVIYPATDATVTPYSGTAIMADGGIAALAAGGKINPSAAKKPTSTPTGFNLSSPKIKRSEPKKPVTPPKPSTVIDPRAAARVAAGLPATASPVPTISDDKVTPIKKPAATDTAPTGLGSLASSKINRMPSAEQQALTALKGYEKRVAPTGAVGGDTYTEFVYNWENRLGGQQNVVDRLAEYAKSPYESVRNKALELLEKQTPILAQIKEDKDKALGELGRGTSIGSRFVQSVEIAPKEQMTLDAAGRPVPTKPTKEYKKILPGQINSLTGWDATPKYLESEDVIQVFNEVAGRDPVPAELNKYLGMTTPVSLQWLANQVNTVADVNAIRGAEKPFTAQEIQDAAKYYLGTELKPGELKSLENTKFANFAALRNHLTGSAMYNTRYIDNLNKINEATFYKKPTTTGGTTGGTTEDGTTEDGTTEGGTSSSGLVPAPVGVALTPADLQKYQQQYGGVTPAGLSAIAAASKKELTDAEKKLIEERAQRLYSPEYVTSPLYTMPGAMAYQDVNKQLGLSNLYEKMSETMPALQSGLAFTPGQAVVPTASAFGNTTPGLVTLQSAAAPQPYTPPTPVLPGTTTQQIALTPEEQLLMSQAQSLQQNQPRAMAAGGYAGGGYNLGDYSDGGRLLKGPGDGVSDSIPASINNRRPARLADGEFVIPARIVSELGNGSTEAGARQLYAMMDRVQKRRRKTVGKGRVAVDSKARSLLPA